MGRYEAPEWDHTQGGVLPPGPPDHQDNIQFLRRFLQK